MKKVGTRLVPENPKEVMKLERLKSRYRNNKFKPIKIKDPYYQTRLWYWL